jgi:hypothetical protein
MQKMRKSTDAMEKKDTNQLIQEPRNKKHNSTTETGMEYHGWEFAIAGVRSGGFTFFYRFHFFSFVLLNMELITIYLNELASSWEE